MSELLNYLNSLGFDGVNTLWLLVPIVVFLFVGYLIYKVISFVVSIVITLALLIFLGGYFLVDSDVNWSNLKLLNDNTTDMMIVGDGDGCLIYAANREVQELLSINGWKKYLKACDKAVEKLEDISKKEGFKKLSLSMKDNPSCPMVLVTNRSQLYLEMAIKIQKNDCLYKEDFKEIIERLNKEEKNDNGTIKKIKDTVLDFIVKDIL